MKKMLNKILRKIKNRFTCAFCADREEVRLAVKFGRFPVDADVNEEGYLFPIYANVGICREHLADYEEGEGIFNPYAYI